MWLVRIADATRLPHGRDSRVADGIGGFGEGTLAFYVDDHGHTRAYGWYGATQDVRTFVPTRIAFARVTR